MSLPARLAFSCRSCSCRISCAFLPAFCGAGNVHLLGKKTKIGHKPSFMALSSLFQRLEGLCCFVTLELLEVKHHIAGCCLLRSAQSIHGLSVPLLLDRQELLTHGF